MGTRGKLALHVVTWVGWLALFASLPLDGQYLGFEMGRLGVAVGPTGSIVLALHKIVVPVAQVFEVGRQIGREESAPNRRHLRIVDGD